MLMAIGVSMAVFAARLGTSGPNTVPAAIIPATCEANVFGNFDITPRAMRAISPLVFMPAPSANAANKSHIVDVENALVDTFTSTPAST